LPDLPSDREGPVFQAPWEAQAFALVLSLYDKGLFTWPEWAAALATQIGRAQAAGDPDRGDTYYRHWLNALEQMVTAKNLTTPDVLARYHKAGMRRPNEPRTGYPSSCAAKISPAEIEPKGRPTAAAPAPPSGMTQSTPCVPCEALRQPARAASPLRRGAPWPV